MENATHEINTPLSVILMSIEMFDKNPKKYLLNIKKASKNLSYLNDKLIVAKIKK
ncbi:histidine kinase dimerization/phospho-acceptor domain-containing protein, partial [Campylobacter ureolyticus]|uniref:histidine kinase dimerization/phospho-acceptor domain-containing protein n=1 Tax=Campylobacter ureolyticus TaxID=827 RepID=UPI00374D0943